jgi:hypothetical protein
MDGHRSPESLTRRSQPMLDLVFVLVTVLFFVVSLGYIAGCDRLE